MGTAKRRTDKGGRQPSFFSTEARKAAFDDLKSIAPKIWLFLMVILIYVFVVGIVLTIWSIESNEFPIQAFVTAAGLALVALTFIISVIINQISQQHQFTLKTLLDMRFSAKMLEDLDLRKDHFPHNQIADGSEILENIQINKDWSSIAEDQKSKHKSSEAVIRLLNYYEFMCVGIIRGDLNEAMLKNSIRMMMCNFVNDFSDFIIKAREPHPNYFANLVLIYNRWRDEEKHTKIEM